MSIPSPRLVTAQVRRPLPDTLRECDLINARKSRPLTDAEVLELEEITESQIARAELAEQENHQRTFTD